MYKEIMKCFEEAGMNPNIIWVKHEEFKKITKESEAIVRTGECSPYANVILKSGVVFRREYEKRDYIENERYS